MSVSTIERLRHILDEIEFINETCGGRERENVLSDAALRRAIVRSLEIIGEAAKNLPDDFRNQHIEIEWRKVCGMRDRLIHGYYTVNLETVWDVVSVHVPQLESVVRKALDEMADDPS